MLLIHIQIISLKKDKLTMILLKILRKRKISLKGWFYLISGLIQQK
jgi:hypothetical protein